MELPDTPPLEDELTSSSGSSISTIRCQQDDLRLSKLQMNLVKEISGCSKRVFNATVYAWDMYHDICETQKE